MPPILARQARRLVTGQRSLVLWDVLASAWDRLGLAEAVGGDRAFMLMMLVRVVEPTSKEQVGRVLGELGVEAVSARTLFRSLARCQERGYRASIQAALHSHVTRVGDLSLLLYDVTTLYLLGPTRRTACARSGTPKNAGSIPRSS